MATKVFVSLYEHCVESQNAFTYALGIWDDVNEVNLGGWNQISVNMGSDVFAPYTEKSIHDIIINHAITFLIGQSITVVASDFIFLYGPQQPLNLNVNNAPSHSFVTTAAAANGFQVSSTKDAMVSYAATIVTTATIGGGSSGTILLEIAATNSSTAGDWKEISRLTNGQTITLALALQSVQTIAGNLNGIVPAGYYARLRTINNSGTPTYTFNSGQEVLM